MYLCSMEGVWGGMGDAGMENLSGGDGTLIGYQAHRDGRSWRIQVEERYPTGWNGLPKQTLRSGHDSVNLAKPCCI